MARLNLSKLKEQITDPKKRVRLILISGAFLLAVPLLLAVGMAGASHPSFCGALCHDQQPNVQTWMDSSHSQVPCYSCHMPAQNIPGFFMDKVKSGITAFVQEFVTGVEYPQNGKSEVALEEIPRETCERCHNMSTRYVSPRPIFSKNMEGKDSETEKKYHTKHLDKGIACTVCHNRVVHAEPTEEEAAKNPRKKEILGLFKQYKAKNEETGKPIEHRYKNFMDMKEGCLRCHTSEKNRDEELMELFPEVEKANPPTACETCHEKGWSGLPVGHGENWRAEHGPVAKKDFSYCMKCHGEKKKFSGPEGEKFCINCHSEAAISKFE